MRSALAGVLGGGGGGSVNWSLLRVDGVEVVTIFFSVSIKSTICGELESKLSCLMSSIARNVFSAPIQDVSGEVQTIFLLPSSWYSDMMVPLHMKEEVRLCVFEETVDSVEKVRSLVVAIAIFFDGSS